ncbi:gp58-like family protein, partial [Streptococcus suis]|uniref:gp58-like family protein n=1 Tax=Streptococcus suis TaxID=1307 RepID=UPI0004A281F6
KPVRLKYGCEAFEDASSQLIDVTTGWKRYASSRKVQFNRWHGFIFYNHTGRWEVGDVLYIRDPQLEDGSIPTTPTPATEDQQIYTETKIAEYKTTVDGRFATLQESVDSKANQVDFQSVKETAQLYERIIGSTEAGIKDKVARMVMADSLFQTDVRDAISGTATQVNQLGNSWVVKNLTSAGTVLNQLNLNKDGSVKIDGKLVQITGTTYIQDGVITSAKIASLDAGKITSGYISAERLDANSITAAKLKVDRAFFDALAANKLLVKDFFAKDAVVT